MKRGFLFVLSGPSGSGKTTIASAVLKEPGIRGEVARSVSVTTRPRRNQEAQGKDYFFVSEGRFLRLRRAKKILEWTRYLGYYYGTLTRFVDATLGKGKSLLLCLDVRGAAAVSRRYPRQTVTIFVKTPSLGALKERIERRACGMGQCELQGRLARARRELCLAGHYDYTVVNRDLPRAVKRLAKIMVKTINTSVPLRRHN